MNDIIPQTEKKSSNNDKVKKRYWRAVMYPESLPENWLEVLKDTMVSFAVSPLHDKDISESDDKQLKKPHYHILFAYENTTTFNNVFQITSKLNQPIPKPADSVKRAYEYLWHKNDADKFQYAKDEVRHFNGFNISNISELEKAEVHQIKIEIQKLIRAKDFKEYADLLDYLLDNQMTQEHEIACTNTIMFRAYLSSRRHKTENKISKPGIEKLAERALDDKQ